MNLYNKNKLDRLKLFFSGAENIDHNYSQAYQDMFVLSMLNGKTNGIYVEIGANDAISINNTYLLESKFDWSGISFDADKSSLESYQKNKRKNNFVLGNALNLNYDEIFKQNGFGNQIDYLQIDIEPNTQTLECLKKMPLDKYRFSTITYETDYYDKTQGCDVAERVRKESREIFLHYGYELIVGNIANLSKDEVFEDWYVDPLVIDKEIIKLFKESSEYNDTAESYILK